MDTNIEYKGYKITIVQDEFPDSPRNWDNLGTMYCFHKRYELGDKHKLDVEDVQEIAASKDYVSLPLYLYDHSGITMNTTGFSCVWDSGQVGIIAVSKEKIRNEYSCKKISKKRIEQVTEYLKNEVAIYDDYLTGNVYGYSVEDRDGNEIDSCWGYFGTDFDKNGLLESAKNHINWELKQTGEQQELFTGKGEQTR